VALLVLAAMGLLHLGVGLVLTRSARAQTASIEQAWTAEELAGAQAPGYRPDTSGPEHAAWSRSQRLWDDAQRRDERRAQTRALTLGLGVSFALQAGFVLWLVWRVSSKRGVRAR
jgi:Flp pilus assembly protein TadB